MRLFSLLAVILAAGGCGPTAAPDGPADVLVVNARIVDGAGNPWYRGDVAIRGSRIERVGDLAGRVEATRVIDANDRVLAPGFIDLMGQSSLILVTDPPSAEAKLRQGITTYLSGEGGSPVPRTPDAEPVEVGGESVTWTTYAEYFDIMEGFGVPINVAHNVGLGQVREAVVGEEDVEPTAGQMEEMRQIVRSAMEDGAIGVSTALIYPPGNYASEEELTELARVSGEYGGVYFTHMRNESGAVLDAISEAMRIGAGAGVPVHIYHLKAAGEENWPLMVRAIALVDSARAEGRDVTADIYPYIRNGIGLGSFLHPRHYASGADAFRETLSDASVRRELRTEVEETSDWENWYRHVGGDWDKVLVVGAPDDVADDVVGRSIAEAAQAVGVDAWTLFFDLVQGGGVNVNPESMNVEQKWQALRAPWVMIDTDTSPVNPANATSTHPRAFGAFPRVLARYVREDRVVTLEEAIRRMTSLAANRLGLWDRGRIAPGMAADLVLFDPDRVVDRATFEAPLQYAQGVDFLFVNGSLVIDEGDLTPNQPGRMLRRGAVSIARASR